MVPSAGSGELPIDYRGMSKGSGLKRESDTLVRIDDDIDGGFDENARFEIKSSTETPDFHEMVKNFYMKVVAQSLLR